MAPLSCKDMKKEIKKQVKNSCLGRWSFEPEEGPMLIPKLIDPSDELKRTEWMYMIESSLRRDTCSDSASGLVQSFGYFGGRKAKKAFYRIMRDEAKMDDNNPRDMCIYRSETALGKTSFLIPIFLTQSQATRHTIQRLCWASH